MSGLDGNGAKEATARQTSGRESKLQSLAIYSIAHGLHGGSATNMALYFSAIVMIQAEEECTWLEDRNTPGNMKANPRLAQAGGCESWHVILRFRQRLV